MNPSESDKMTPFDKLISSKELQMLKLFIPYVPAKSQGILAIYAKFIELKYTLQLFRNLQRDLHAQTCQKTISSPFDMLDEIRPYLSEEEQNKLDSITNLLSMMELISSMQDMADSNQEHSDMGGIDLMDMLKNMLDPDSGEKGDSTYE